MKFHIFEKLIENKFVNEIKRIPQDDSQKRLGFT